MEGQYFDSLKLYEKEKDSAKTEPKNYSNPGLNNVI
jgi:hypothetical protein